MTAARPARRRYSASAVTLRWRRASLPSRTARNRTAEPSRKPYYQDDTVTLWAGDALAVLRDLPDESVDCVVTSPPYFQLRDYAKDGQIGQEDTPQAFVARLTEVFAEVRRVLAKDGTCWVNMGDSYAVRWGSARREGRRGFAHEAPRGRTGVIRHDIPEKNMLGIPWRLALALQDDGWYLRNDIIWAKPNGLPEAVQDRLSNRYEHVFLLTKARRYWFDLDPIREPHVSPQTGRAATFARATKEAVIPGQSAQQHRNDRTEGPAHHPKGRNPGDIWTIPTQPYPGAHFAVMPLALAQRCIQAGCKPGGVVMDPFSGSGTTGQAAGVLGHRYVGIDLNTAFLDLSLNDRLAQPTLLDINPGVPDAA